MDYHPVIEFNKFRSLLAFLVNMDAISELANTVDWLEVIAVNLLYLSCAAIKSFVWLSSIDTNIIPKTTPKFATSEKYLFRLPNCI
jgi:hypothetical protein